MNLEERARELLTEEIAPYTGNLDRGARAAIRLAREAVEECARTVEKLYRDGDGRATIDVIACRAAAAAAIRSRFAAPKNQCDGCRRGLPLKDGIHSADEGYDMIACTAELYAGAPQEEHAGVAERPKASDCRSELRQQPTGSTPVPSALRRRTEGERRAYLQGHEAGAESARRAALSGTEQNYLSEMRERVRKRWLGYFERHDTRPSAECVAEIVEEEALPYRSLSDYWCKMAMVGHASGVREGLRQGADAMRGLADLPENNEFNEGWGIESKALRESGALLLARASAPENTPSPTGGSGHDLTSAKAESSPADAKAGGRTSPPPPENEKPEPSEGTIEGRARAYAHEVKRRAGPQALDAADMVEFTRRELARPSPGADAARQEREKVAGSSRASGPSQEAQADDSGRSSLPDRAELVERARRFGAAHVRHDSTTTMILGVEDLADFGAALLRERALPSGPLTEQELRDRSGGYLYVGNGCEMAIRGTTEKLRELRDEVDSARALNDVYREKLRERAPVPENEKPEDDRPTSSVFERVAQVYDDRNDPNREQLAALLRDRFKPLVDALEQILDSEGQTPLTDDEVEQGRAALARISGQKGR